jgi:hypothetical protein
MVAIINSILMGVFLSFLVTRFLPLSVLLAVVCGIGAFLASFSIHLLFQSRRWQHLEQHVLVLFPSDET